MHKRCFNFHNTNVIITQTQSNSLYKQKTNTAVAANIAGSTPADQATPKLASTRINCLPVYRTQPSAASPSLWNPLRGGKHGLDKQPAHENIEGKLRCCLVQQGWC